MGPTLIFFSEGPEFPSYGSGLEHCGRDRIQQAGGGIAGQDMDLQDLLC